MAQTFSQLVDEATKGIASARRAGIRTAIKDCQTALDSEFTSYTLNEKDEQAVEDKLIDLCRYLESAIR